MPRGACMGVTLVPLGSWNMLSGMAALNCACLSTITTLPCGLPVSWRILDPLNHIFWFIFRSGWPLAVIWTSYSTMPDWGAAADRDGAPQPAAAIRAITAARPAARHVSDGNFMEISFPE